MKYLLAAGISVFSCFVLFITLKEEYKKICIGLIAGVILAFCLCIGIKLFAEEPEICIIGEPEVIINVGEEYIENGAKAYYKLFDISSQIDVISNVDKNKIGTYEVSYEISTTSKYARATRTVYVVDNIPPKIVLNGDKNIIIGSLELYKEAGYKAEDNYDGDITKNVEINTSEISEDIYERTYSIKDSSGNTCTEVRKIVVKDIVPPEIKIEGNEVENMYIGGMYEESGAVAVDDIDGDITDKIEVTSDIDTSKLGKYTVVYSVKDKGGNIAKTTRRVEVVPEPELQGVVFLTFDDGPSTSTTPYILDILKEEGVQATFFILNYDENTEYLVKRIVDEGHTIAIHGYSHDYSYIYQSEDIYMNNLKALRDKIKETTGVDTTITRFPGGSSNMVSSYNPGIMTRLTKKVIDEGYRYFDWNVSSGDAGDASSSSEVYYNVTNNVKRERRNVVLMHDFSGNSKTLNALRDIIQYLKNEGYAIEKITQDTPMITHRVAN